MRDMRGITLVALVITIIILLILAGVAISLTIGNNGIFQKSKEGAEIYKNSANNEATHLNQFEHEMTDLINQYQNQSTPTPTPPPGNPDANGIYTQNSTINGGTAEAFNPEIPKGFKPVNEDPANWGNGINPPSEEAIKAGLVIEDAEGNQFVWIAVDGETVKLNRYTFATDGTETPQNENIIEDYYITSNSYQELVESTSGNAVAKDIEEFKASVTTHGGYYIARYEASYGTDGKPNSKISTKISLVADGVAHAPTAEGQLWNCVTQPQAAIACSNMYDSNYGITSDLINSYAWDTAILFIQKYSGATNYARNPSGRSINPSFVNTGTNKDEKCNINDILGNFAEWSTETSINTTLSCVNRGGNANNSDTYASFRYHTTPDTALKNVSFRPILYFKQSNILH